MIRNSPRTQMPSYVVTILALCGGTVLCLSLVVVVFAYIFLNSTAVLVHRAAAFQAKKRYREAEPLLIAAARQSPQDPEIANNVAWTFYLDGRYAEGAPYARRSIALTRQYYNLDTMAHLELGLKQYADAESNFKSALHLRPNNTYSLDGLGQVYEGSGRLDKALATYRKAMEIGSGVEGTRERMSSVEKRLMQR